MRYKLSCTWTMWGTLEVEADSEKEAIEKAYYESLPYDSHYVDDSFEVEEDTIECIENSRVTRE